MQQQEFAQNEKELKIEEGWLNQNLQSKIADTGRDPRKI